MGLTAQLGETVVAALSWSACSISMSLLNKMAVSTTNAPLAVVALQMGFTVLLALASRDLRFGQGAMLWAATVPPLFLLMMVSSMIALQHVSVGTFVVVRNLGPLISLAVETAIDPAANLRCDVGTVACTAAIAIGVAMYEAHDIRFSAVGAAYLILNLAAAIAERMLQRHLLAVRQVDVSKPALMVLNNGIGGLATLALVLTVSPHELSSLAHSLQFRRGAAIAVGASCVIGSAISYTGLWLQRLVSSTTFMVLGSFTKMVVIAFGVFFLGDASSAISICGALLSIYGSFAYARLGKKGEEAAKTSQELLGGAVVMLLLALVYSLGLDQGHTQPPPAADLSQAAAQASNWASNGISQSSSGMLFAAVRTRSYTGQRLYATWQPPEKPTQVVPEAGGLQCRNWAVTTSIFAPTKTVEQLAAMPNWCLVVAGDKQGPAEYNVSGRAVYLTPEAQEAMLHSTGKLLRWNHFGRKNLGFLYAIAHGARWVYDTDDDNELVVNGAPTRIGLPAEKKGDMAEAQTSAMLQNLYPVMGGHARSWPRGFPLEAIKRKATQTAKIRQRAFNSRRVGVIQSLANHDPDVDAIYRLTQPLPFDFEPPSVVPAVPVVPAEAAERPPGRRLAKKSKAKKALEQFKLAEQRSAAAAAEVAGGSSPTLQPAPAVPRRSHAITLRPGTMMPYNSQATLHAYDALWGLLLPCTVHGRVTDIWRSYFTQRLLWDIGMRVAFSPPWVTQLRNPHKLLADFNSEIPLYQQAGAIVQALTQWKPTTATLPGRLEELYIFMYEAKVVELSDVSLVQAWISDLLRLGYRFPPIAPHRKLAPAERISARANSARSKSAAGAWKQ